MTYERPILQAIVRRRPDPPEESWYALSYTRKANHKTKCPDVRDVVGTTVLAIVCGFTRCVHINRLRNDTVLAALLGLGPKKNAPALVQGEGDTVFAHAHRRVHETNFRKCEAVGLQSRLGADNPRGVPQMAGRESREGPASGAARDDRLKRFGLKTENRSRNNGSGQRFIASNGDSRHPTAFHCSVLRVLKIISSPICPGYWTYQAMKKQRTSFQDGCAMLPM